MTDISGGTALTLLAYQPFVSWKTAIVDQNLIKLGVDQTHEICMPLSYDKILGQLPIQFHISKVFCIPV